jgi:hypothetical protein
VFCGKCGTEIDTPSRFCDTCGSPLPPSGEEPQRGEQQWLPGSPSSSGDNSQPLLGRTASHRRRNKALGAAVAVMVIVAAILVTVLHGSSSSPTSVVNAFVHAIESDNVNGAIGDIDPGNRPAIDTNGFGEEIGGALLSTIRIQGFAVVGQTIEGDHAWVTVRGQICSTILGCSGENVSGLLASLTGVSSTAATIPCELVDGTWYVYGGTGSWATRPYAPTAVHGSAATTSAPSPTSAPDTNSTSTTVAAGSPSVALKSLAGDATSGYSTSPVPATAAEFNFCSNSNYGTTCASSFAVDQRGNMYVPEEGNNVVQVIAGATSSALLPGMALTPGDVYTVAGNGSCGSGGDGVPASSTQLCSPSSVAIDKSGNLIIADFGNSVVRLVAASTSDPLMPGTSLVAGDIYTIAGGATSNPCDASVCGPGDVQFENPSGVATEPDGDLVIVAMGDNQVWLLAAHTSDPLLPGQVLRPGHLYLVAGNGQQGDSGDSGSASQAELDWPFGAATDQNGSLYISDTINGEIRMVAATSSNPLLPGAHLTPGDIYTVAGNGTQGYSGDGGPATKAEIDQAHNELGDSTPKYGGVAVDQEGNLYIPDASNQVIRLVAATTSDRFYPGHALVPGDIYTIAGTGQEGSTTAGPATSAQLYAPSAIGFVPSGDLVFVDAGNNQLWSASPR